jgi:putative endonuclease
MGRNNIVGAWGESIAAEYLRKKRYTVLASGYRCRFGEIDLIVCDRKYLVFVEVKLRKNDRFASAMEFVDIHKQSRIRITAEIYLSQNPTDLQPRFDVIEIYAPDGLETKNPVIHHMEDAFT